MTDRSFTLGVVANARSPDCIAFVQRLNELQSSYFPKLQVRALAGADIDVPSASAAFHFGTRSPGPALREIAVNLRDQGCDLLILPSSDAHIWFAQVASDVDVPLLHLPSLVEAELQRLRVDPDATVGLVARPCVQEARVFEVSGAWRRWASLPSVCDCLWETGQGESDDREVAPFPKLAAIVCTRSECCDATDRSGTPVIHTLNLLAEAALSYAIGGR